MASQLDLELLEIVAEPYAVARVLGSDQVRQAGALFVDVGGGTTDVALVRQGGIEGTRMFALGGRAFTKTLADRLDLPFPRAEALKVDYARGRRGRARRRTSRRSSPTTSAVWAAGVELVMEELSGGDLLPGRIYLCGGGSRLPEIRAALAVEAFCERLPFARPPEVIVMAPDQIDTISDATDLLVDQQDVTPLGLAYQAIELQTSEDAARRRAAPRPPRDEGLTDGRPDHLPRRRRRDHLGGRPHPRRRGGADRGRAAVRLAGRDVADQLPAAGARGADPRQAAVDRGRRSGDAGARGVGRAAGLRLGRRVRVGDWPGRTTTGRGRRRRLPVVAATRGRGGAASRAQSRGEPRDAGEPASRERQPTAAGLGRDARARRPGRGRGRAAPLATPSPVRPATRSARPSTSTPDAPATRAPAPPTAAAAGTPTGPLAGADRPARRRAAVSGRRGSSVARSSPWRCSSAASAPTCSCRRRRSSSRREPEPIGPIQLTVVADTDATEPDPRRGVVPAEEISIPVEVDDTFPATGKRVEVTKATGDGPLREPRPDEHQPDRRGEHRADRRPGSASGRDVTITVPRAELVGLTIFPARASVKVTAVDGGPDGNVEPTRSSIVPSGENRSSSRSPTPRRRPAATQRGVHAGHPGRTSTARWPRSTRSLQAAFERGDGRPGARPPAARRSSPRPASLGEADARPSPPETLVGQEVATFALGLSATGTVIAVDTAPVSAIAETAAPGRGRARPRARPGLGRGRRRRRRSSSARRSASRSTATAEQVAVLDPDELEAMVLGKPIDEARAILEPFGEVELDVWPDWAGSVPSFESRVDADRRPRPSRSRRRAPPRRPSRDSGDAREPAVTRLLGIDLGERRIGLAIADDDGSAARRCRRSAAAATSTPTRRRCAPSSSAQGVDELVVGLPLEASGDEGPQAALTRAWGDAIARSARSSGIVPRRAADQPPRRGPARAR